MLNSYFKISLHAMGVGGALAAIILFAMYYKLPLGAQISVTAIIAGTVCTSRLLVSDHTNKEIYTGLFAGILSQIAAYWFIM